MNGKMSTEEGDLHSQADEALEAARALPNGPEKVAALKRAGLLRLEADKAGVTFAKIGRPRKDG
jgi:hypothetical protein